MSHPIHPFSSSGPGYPQKPVPPGEADDHARAAATPPPDSAAPDTRSPSQVPAPRRVQEADPPQSDRQGPRLSEADGVDAGAFGTTLKGALDQIESGHPLQPLLQAPDTPPLSPAEHQMIFRYFPESPRLSLCLYSRDLAPQTVDPTALGARVDLRG